MHIGAIIQARMSSRRLPGKIMRPLAGRPMLQCHLDRVLACTGLDTIIVATSSQPDDDPVAAWCGRAGVRCTRGPLDDVAARFAAAVRAEELDAFVRLCADSPFIDPALIDLAVQSFRDNPVHVVTNVHPRTWPAGQSVEVVDAATFLTAEARMDSPGDREHVTSVFYRDDGQYRVRNITADRDRSAIRLVVDTPEDLARARALAARLGGAGWRCGLATLLTLLEPALP